MAIDDELRLESDSIESKLPIELIELILTHLNLKDLVNLRRLNSFFNNLLSLPHLYSTINLHFLPTIHPNLLLFLPTILSGTQTLSLRSFSNPIIHYLLPFTSSIRLTILDLSFSSVTDSTLLEVLTTNKGGSSSSLEGLKSLKLKGCRLIRDGTYLSTLLPKLERLDLSWSSIETLPSPSISSSTSSTSLSSSSSESNDSGFFDSTDIESPKFFPSLLRLSLSSCPALQFSTISHFLSSLPPTLQTLDLSHLGVTYQVLSSLYQPLLPTSSTSSFQSNEKKQLTKLDLRGNDRIHKNDIKNLECFLGKEVEIVNEALLESEAEEDVRRFVELVSGGINRVR